MRGQRGFTMVELMVVVAIIAILALVVVPTFMRDSRRTKSSTEITPMFAELSTREAQYKQESGAYLAVAACPASPSKTLQDIRSTCMTSSAWTTLRMQPHETALRCSYAITIGAAATDPTPSAPVWVTGIPATQAESWYYILATCDGDGNGTNGYFFQSSWDARIQSKDESE